MNVQRLFSIIVVPQQSIIINYFFLFKDSEFSVSTTTNQQKYTIPIEKTTSPIILSHFNVCTVGLYNNAASLAKEYPLVIEV